MAPDDKESDVPIRTREEIEQDTQASTPHMNETGTQLGTKRRLSFGFGESITSLPLISQAAQSTSKKRNHDGLSVEGSGRPNIVFGEHSRLVKKPRLNTNLPDADLSVATDLPATLELDSQEKQNTCKKRGHDDISGDNGNGSFVSGESKPSQPEPVAKDKLPKNWEHKTFVVKGETTVLRFEALGPIREAYFTRHNQTRVLMIDGETYERGHAKGQYKCGWVRLMNPGQMENHDGVFYIALRCAFVLGRNYTPPSFIGPTGITRGSIEHDARGGNLFIGSKREFSIDGFEYMEYDLLLPQWF